MDEPTPAVEPTSDQTYINPDGTWKEGWKDALVPEDLRVDKFYDSPFCANVPELLKTAGNQAKALGKKGIAPLNEKSSEFEVGEWRKAHGVPDTYIYNKPELKMLELSDEFVTRMKGEMNAVHINQKQFDTVTKIFHDFWREKEAEFEKSETESISKINQQILQDENTEYETNSQHIDMAVRQFTQGWADEDVLKLFGTVDSKGGINSNDHIELKPLMRRFLVNVGKSMGEHKTVIGDAGGKSIQQQLDEAMKDPAYLEGYGKPHQEAVDRVLKLREQLNKQLGKS